MNYLLCGIPSPLFPSPYNQFARAGQPLQSRFPDLIQAQPVTWEHQFFFIFF